MSQSIPQSSRRKNSGIHVNINVAMVSQAPIDGIEPQKPRRQSKRLASTMTSSTSSSSGTESSAPSSTTTAQPVKKTKIPKGMSSSMAIPEFYLESREQWREWLLQNHESYPRVHLVFYKVTSQNPSMRWEEAVKEALCFGWIDSTVKRLDDERRRQLFTPRKESSTWSKVNKEYVHQLIEDGLMHASGLAVVNRAKQNGSWTSLDDVESLVIPTDLQRAFDQSPTAWHNYQAFSRGYRKSYLYWLNQAKRDATRESRIAEIIRLCHANIKARP